MTLACPGLVNIPNLVYCTPNQREGRVVDCVWLGIGYEVFEYEGRASDHRRVTCTDFDSTASRGMRLDM